MYAPTDRKRGRERTHQVLLRELLLLGVVCAGNVPCTHPTQMVGGWLGVSVCVRMLRTDEHTNNNNHNGQGYAGLARLRMPAACAGDRQMRVSC